MRMRINSPVVNRQHVSSVPLQDGFYNLEACLCLQVSAAAAMSPGPQSEVQTFTIGVLPQVPGFPQLAPDCDLQISVRDQKNPFLLPLQFMN